MGEGVKRMILREKIESILESKIWNGTECPYCSYKGKKPRQTTHHITAAHPEKYKNDLTKEARILNLIVKEKNKVVSGIGKKLFNKKPKFGLKFWQKGGYNKAMKNVREILTLESKKSRLSL